LSWPKTLVKKWFNLQTKAGIFMLMISFMKGSISISMSLHQTSFCFVCSHLTSGEKDGDELRRNSDVMEILRKTRFPQVHAMGDENSPQTILDHDRIIWLGDLNYRIALAYRCAKALVEMRNWRALLENDQLRIEQRHGRVFAGWNEGRIYFPPTYKYSNNSDRYAGENTHPKEKRRNPAWCDRILWRGPGLRQLSYVRGESRFSDHRPVYSIFLAEIESINCSRIKKSTSYSSSRVEVEELLSYSYGHGGPESRWVLPLIRLFNQNNSSIIQMNCRQKILTSTFTISTSVHMLAATVKRSYFALDPISTQIL
ncbi:UNVERIFIED_CONTAM: Type IV inositol polyphosphate 5-phosphatase 6, partial [Sesamum angustifolium]